MGMKRRKFINQLGLGAAVLTVPNTVLSFTPSFSKANKEITFGLVADVHKDLMPDANGRLEVFIEQAQKRKVDFIIQMGDFCFAEIKNKEFLNIWKHTKAPNIIF